MIAKFLQESSILMKNKEDEIKKILKKFHLDGFSINDFFLKSLNMSDGKPGNWFLLENGEEKHFFISCSHVSVKQSRSGFKERFRHDIIIRLSYWGKARASGSEIYSFGEAVPLSEVDALKEMSVYVRNLMKLICKKNTANEIITILDKEAEKQKNRIWGQTK